MTKTVKYLSLATKIMVAVCSLLGICLSIFRPGADHPHWNSLLYFTIQSNFWIAIICLVGAWLLARDIPAGRFWSVSKMVFTVSITLTGAVFCFILAPTMTDGNPFELSSCLVHVFAPLFAVLDLVLCGKSYDLKYKDALWVIVPPLYYFTFASIGYVLDWQFAPGLNYPYFFLNWGSPLGAFGFGDSLPFMGVMWYFLALSIALIIVGNGYILISRAEKKL